QLTPHSFRADGEPTAAGTDPERARRCIFDRVRATRPAQRTPLDESLRSPDADGLEELLDLLARNVLV
ncbi:MAG: hypothetical protein MUE50_26475, partial [Pirellulaceae bacterium]|nr:hypothetical protein [Pirellulaceae bacterium]